MKHYKMINRPFDCLLSDFTAEQLRTILSSLYDNQTECLSRKQSYERVETLAVMFACEIVDLDRQIENINEIMVQFAGALQIKEKENQIASN